MAWKIKFRKHYREGVVDIVAGYDDNVVIYPMIEEAAANDIIRTQRATLDTDRRNSDTDDR